MFSQVCIANYDVFQSLSMSYIQSTDGKSRDNNVRIYNVTNKINETI